MADGGGRDTETDFLVIKAVTGPSLSKNTYTSPCPCCGGIITKEAYMGGSVIIVWNASRSDFSDQMIHHVFPKWGGVERLFDLIV